MQISVAGKPHAGGLHLQFGRGGDMNIEPNPVQQPVGRRQGGTLGAVQVPAEIEARRHGQLGDDDFPVQRRGGRTAHKMQIGVGHGADAGGIAQAHILPAHGKVEVKLAVIGGRVAAKRDQAAAGVRCETLDLQAVLIEDQRPVDIAQRAGQIDIGDGAMLATCSRPCMTGLATVPPTDTSTETTPEEVKSGLKLSISFRLTRPWARKSSSRSPLKMHLAVRRNVGVLTHQMELVNLQGLVGNGKTDRPLVLDLDVFDVGVQVVEVGGELQFAGPPQRTHHVHFAVRPGMSSHSSAHVGSKDRIQFELMEAEVHVRGPVLAQMNVAIDLDVRLFELGLSGNSQLRPLGHRVNGELAGAFLVERKIVEMNGRVERWAVPVCRSHLR